MFDILANIPLIGPSLAYLLPFLLVLGVVVFIHEYGHYIVGRWCGIRAEVFSIGFGPVLLSWQDKEQTNWQIAAIPLGGYVKFLGDQNAASTNSAAQNPIYPARAHFHLAPLWARTATVLAGPIFNFILSLIVFGGLIIYNGVPSNRFIIDEIHPQIAAQYDLRQGDEILSIDGYPLDTPAGYTALIDLDAPPMTMPYRILRDGQALQLDGPYPFIPIVGSVVPVSPAVKAGLQPGDIILSIGNQSVSTFGALRDLVVQMAQTEQPIDVMRDGAILRLKITPKTRAVPTADGGIQERVAIGIFAGSIFSTASQPARLSDVVTGSFRTLINVITDSVNGIVLIIRGDIGVDNLQGPVGIAHVAGDVAKSGWIDLIALIGYLSVAIGFLNLLPIPVLDGGHLVMFLYEAIRKRPPDARVVQYLTIGAMSLLLTLMAVVTFNDIIRITLFAS